MTLQEIVVKLRDIVSELEAIETPSVSVQVPYVSQWGAGAGTYQSDCGPACVEMLREYKGLPRVDVDKISLAAGMTPTTPGTTGPQLIQAALQFGPFLKFVRGWTLELFASRLPCIVLVHYGSIPTRRDDGYVKGHWVVVTGVSPDMVTFHDPDWWRPRIDDGQYKLLQRDKFEKAIADCSLDGNTPGQGLILA
jgi:ABC-type bacteriocin/lantibiotic exporter with double-glycine peptidase domain